MSLFRDSFNLAAASTLLLAACSSTPPIEEFALARTALLAAKTHQSARYAPAEWHQAEEAYRKGRRAFKKKEFDLANEWFEQTIFYAEKAEERARIRKQKSGEL